jgi:hypothetical protein
VKVGPLLAHLQELEAALAAELRASAERHRDDHDVYHQCQTFAVTADKRERALGPLKRQHEGRALWSTALGNGSADLLEDLRMLYLRTQETAITWVMVAQAAKATRDRDLLTLATDCQTETELQGKWFTTRIKTGAPQALVME